MKTLRELLDELADAAAYTAHRASEHSLAYHLSHYDVRDGAHHPQVHPVSLDGGETVIPGLRPAMVGEHGAVMERIEIETETDVTEDTSTCGRGLLVGLTSGLRRKRSHVKIKAAFAVVPSPEGVAIVRERMHGHIRDATGGATTSEGNENG